MARKKGRIGITIGLDGEKEFKQAISNINSEAKVLQAEMKKVTAEFKDNSNSVEALTKKQEVLQKQYDTQAKKIEVYQEALKNAMNNQDKIVDETEKYKKTLADAEKEMERMKSSSSTTAEELGNQEEKIEQLKNALDASQKAYKDQEKRINSWKTSLINAETGLIDFSKGLEIIKSDMSGATSGIDKASDKFEKFADSQEEAKDASSNFGEILKANLGAEIIHDGLQKITDGIKDVTEAMVSVGSDFESGMSNVAATMGMTVKDVETGANGYKELANAAKEAGATTKYSAAEGAEALNYLALAGYDTQKAIEALPEILTGASAGGMDLASTSDMVTDSMSALKLETSEMGSYIDKLAKTSQKSNTNIAQLGEGILQVGGTAKNLKGGVVELTTELGILADNGIKSAEGGTALRNIILEMTPTTEKAQKAWKALGVSAYDADGNLRGLNEVFKDLNTATKDMTKEERTNVLTKMFNKTDLKAVEALMSNCGKRFDTLSSQIKKSSGAAKEMSDVMQNNLKGDIDNLSSATEALGIAAYEKFGGKFRKAVSSVTDEVSDLQEQMDDGKLGNSVEKLGDKVGEIADELIQFCIQIIPDLVNGASWICDNIDLIIDGLGVLGGLLVFTKAVSGIKSLITTFQTLSSVVGLATKAQSALNIMQMSSPVGLLVGAVAGLIGAWKIYNSTVADTNEKNDHLIDVLGDAKNELKDFEKECKEAKKAFNENIGSTMVDSATLDSTIERLYDLAEVEEKSAGQKEAMKILVDELNEKLPELGLKYDKNKDSLNKEKEAVEKLANAQKEQLVQEALRERYKEIISESAEAYLNLAEAQENYNKMQGDFKTTENEAYSAMQKYNAEMKELGYVTANTQAEYEKHYGTIDIWTRSINDAKKVVDKYEKSVKKSDGTLQDLEKCMEDPTGFTAVIGNTKDATKAVEDYGEKVSKVKDKTKNAVNESVKSGKKAAEKSKEIGDNISAGIARGITGGLPSLTKAAKNAVNAALKAAKKEADIHSPSKRSEKEVGAPIGQGVVKGIEGQISNAENAMKGVVNAAYSGDPLKVNNVTNQKTIVQPSSIDYDQMKNVFVDAVKSLKLEFRGDKMAEFVDQIVYELSR